MKNLISFVVLLFCFIPLIGISQIVVLNDGTIINKSIQQVHNGKIIYYQKFPNGSNYIPISMVKEVIGNKYKSREKSILKNNPNVIFSNREIDLSNTYGILNEAPIYDTQNHTITDQLPQVY